jgi:hypothetical protein
VRFTLYRSRHETDAAVFYFLIFLHLLIIPHHLLIAVCTLILPVCASGAADCTNEYQSAYSTLADQVKLLVKEDLRQTLNKS